MHTDLTGVAPGVDDTRKRARASRLECGAQRMNDINTIGDRPMKQTSGDRGRQTLNSGGRIPAELDTALATSPLAGASVCTHCDGTGWTHHATKGLTRCTQQTGTPHD